MTACLLSLVPWMRSSTWSLESCPAPRGYERARDRGSEAVDTRGSRCLGCVNPSVVRFDSDMVNGWQSAAASRSSRTIRGLKLQPLVTY
ncbi:uncharacterized protein C8Q71DRAFT_765763 [Rhodofomes roseus]|uniref:Secreted protein n=1 Tax=Rhodofomes roseus TaxID=34475 RepID=A0ABQ8KD41_9APHY|nr:uncharacterized protein C8Q71DRAFT_765763 [Rhodofomes roseus]KAH9835416.1 hypothetical protein C8Q71DRAFT_765763 [Rhodofomes roseus]